MKATQMFKVSMVALFLCGTLFGCASTKPDAQVSDQANVSQADMSQKSDVKGVGEGSMKGDAVPSHDAVAGLQRIHFDFDQFTLSADARRILGDNAKFLAANGNLQVVIEGHCDERGSDEYNLALGESRALAARNYLISLGVSASRLSVSSYGEEKPLSAGSNEEAWAQNRRAEFKAVH